jgi:hypothetical protein
MRLVSIFFFFFFFLLYVENELIQLIKIFDEHFKYKTREFHNISQEN